MVQNWGVEAYLRKEHESIALYLQPDIALVATYRNLLLQITIEESPADPEAAYAANHGRVGEDTFRVAMTEGRKHSRRDQLPSSTRQ
jgi:hypothetical protein